MYNPGPAFVVSLDFELRWGMRDTWPATGGGDAMLKARAAVASLLDLLQGRGIHATWATVGFLLFNGREELLAALPEILPEYTDTRLSPYPELSRLGPSEAADPEHFAPSLVKRIVRTPGQELACHTFSHYYCLEPGQGPEAFRADIAAVRQAAKSYGVVLRSLVLPRNQVNPAYLPILPELGIICYRGTPDSRMYQPTSMAGNSSLSRAARLLDAYLPLTGRGRLAFRMISNTPPINVRASRFLRPCSPHLAAFEGLRLRRIRDEMSHAAREGLVYHLWWHPHNTGLRLERNLAFIGAVLSHYSVLRDRYGMRSLSMAEIASEMLGDRAESAASLF